MTFSEIADFICGKVNQRETEDVVACKGFLTRRHDMIWAEETWKDSLVEYRQTLDADVADYTVASNYLPTKGVLLLPPIFQRVLAARTSTRKLNIQRPEYFYRIDFDSFARSGEPADYILLPPCVWELEAASYWLARRGDAADAPAVLTGDLLDADGAGVTRRTTDLSDSAYDNLLGEVESERLDTLQKAATSAAVTVSAVPKDLVLSGSSVSEANGTFLRDGTSDGKPYWGAFATGEVIWTGSAWSINVASALSGGIPTTHFLSSESVPLPHLVTAWTSAFVGQTAPTFPSPSEILSLSASDRNARRRQRLRLVEIPTAEVAIRVLGKRYAPAFSADNDEPGICGMENCLIAFALGDMLERDESYTEAAAKFEEAMELLKQLKKVEVAQQAHNCRVIPESGYGDDFFETPRGFNF